MEEKLKKEDFDTIKKFLKQMDKTFLDAKSCRSCRESCGDIFYNKYEKVYDLVVDIEEQFFELTK